MCQLQGPARPQHKRFRVAGAHDLLRDGQTVVRCSHVFCSFLALVLRKALQDRLDAAGHGDLEWSHIIDDLDQLQEVELTIQDKGYRVRTETKGTNSAVFRACGVALPPVLQSRND